jgi:hypothetical protein
MTIHGTFFVFFTEATQNVLSSENLCANIECSDIHAKFIFDFF